MPFPVPPTIAAEIDRIQAFVVKAFKDDNMKELAEAYLEDGMLLPAGAPIVQGQPNIAHGFQTMKASLGAHHSTLVAAHRHAYDSSAQPDGVFELGTYEFYTADDELLDRGKFIVLYHKVAGDSRWSYKMAYDMFSSNS